MALSPNILLCRCSHYHRVPEAVCEAIMQRLDEAGAAYEAVDDLCGAAAEDKAAMRRWSSVGRLHVVACYPRAIRWLFHMAGAALNADGVRLFNGITEEAGTIVAGLKEGAAAVSGPALRAELFTGWVPWYPAIDYDRCVNCRQCLDFCLFGVFGVSNEGRVEVVNPHGCKTNCPACARVCPRRAIIFPKYEKSPINGDEVDENALDEARERAELEAFLGGDIHEVIRQRAARKRFARKGEEHGGFSAEERRKRLARLQKELDIPQEVLDSLSGQVDGAAGDCGNTDSCGGGCGREGEA